MSNKICVVAGARPNFVKIAPLMRELRARPELFEPLLVHTGQHYDFAMSESFFHDLDIPTPDINLNVGSASHATQTAEIMMAFGSVMEQEQPKLVIVVGDVNSTLACSLVASKLHVRVAHIEAGLRSFDCSMPEEINRIVTDVLSDYLFVSEESGMKNLRRMGIKGAQVFFVGNIMIDTLLSFMDRIDRSLILQRLQLSPGGYGVVTLHRPSNVDDLEPLQGVMEMLEVIACHLPLVYPVHPRTRHRMEIHGLLEAFEALPGLTMIEPLGYIDFVQLIKQAKLVLTDSGGIQEETTMLGVPCLTLRDNTERPVTITNGTNRLIGNDHRQLFRVVESIVSGNWKKARVPALWDGHTAQRIVAILERDFLKRPTLAAPLRTKKRDRETLLFPPYCAPPVESRRP